MQVPLVEDDHVVERILPHGRNPAFRHTRYTRKTRRTALARAEFRIESLQWLNMFGVPG